MQSQNFDLILASIQEKYTALLSDNLVGIYVHGSIAFQCFRWEKSDIDYLVVIKKPLCLDEKQALMEATVSISKKAPKKGLEMSVVQKKYCEDFVYPTPYELHFSNRYLKWWQDNPTEYCEKMNGSDPDWAAHFTIIKHTGIALCGEEISRVFSKVDENYYLDSIKADIKDAKDSIFMDPVYVVLNLCRVLAYKEDGSILSKQGGGEWGILKLPHEYQGIIESALGNYGSDAQEKILLEESEAIRFCDFMLERIF